jgi:hypothetical protein
MNFDQPLTSLLKGDKLVGLSLPYDQALLKKSCFIKGIILCLFNLCPF